MSGGRKLLKFGGPPPNDRLINPYLTLHGENQPHRNEPLPGAEKTDLGKISSPWDPVYTPLDIDAMTRDMQFILTDKSAKSHMLDFLETVEAEPSSFYDLLSKEKPSQTEKQFFIDFVLWLAGKSKCQQDIDNTPWLKRLQEGENWDFLKHVIPGDDVYQFLNLLLSARMKFSKQLEKLKVSFHGGLVPAYLYFKYIVRGRKGKQACMEMADDWFGDLRYMLLNADGKGAAVPKQVEGLTYPSLLPPVTTTTTTTTTQANDPLRLKGGHTERVSEGEEEESEKEESEEGSAGEVDEDTEFVDAVEYVSEEEEEPTQIPKRPSKPPPTNLLSSAKPPTSKPPAPTGILPPKPVPKPPTMPPTPKPVYDAEHPPSMPLPQLPTGAAAAVTTSTKSTREQLQQLQQLQSQLEDQNATLREISEPKPVEPKVMEDFSSQVDFTTGKISSLKEKVEYERSRAEQSEAKYTQAETKYTEAATKFEKDKKSLQSEIVAKDMEISLKESQIAQLRTRTPTLNSAKATEKLIQEKLELQKERNALRATITSKEQDLSRVKEELKRSGKVAKAKEKESALLLKNMQRAKEEAEGSAQVYKDRIRNYEKGLKQMRQQIYAINNTKGGKEKHKKELEELKEGEDLLQNALGESYGLLNGMVESAKKASEEILRLEEENAALGMAKTQVEQEAADEQQKSAVEKDKLSAQIAGLKHELEGAEQAVANTQAEKQAKKEKIRNIRGMLSKTQKDLEQASLERDDYKGRYAGALDQIRQLSEAGRQITQEMQMSVLQLQSSKSETDKQLAMVQGYNARHQREMQSKVDEIKSTQTALQLAAETNNLSKAGITNLIELMATTAALFKLQAWYTETLHERMGLHEIPVIQQLKSNQLDWVEKIATTMHTGLPDLAFRLTHGSQRETLQIMQLYTQKFNAAVMQNADAVYQPILKEMNQYLQMQQQARLQQQAQVQQIQQQQQMQIGYAPPVLAPPVLVEDVSSQAVLALPPSQAHLALPPPQAQLSLPPPPVQLALPPPVDRLMLTAPEEGSFMKNIPEATLKLFEKQPQFPKQQTETAPSWPPGNAANMFQQQQPSVNANINVFSKDRRGTGTTTTTTTVNAPPPAPKKSTGSFFSGWFGGSVPAGTDNSEFIRAT